MVVLPGGWGLWVFIVGAVVGSFLNVCIYRLPLGNSVVRPASHCPHCRTPLYWYHNIPLLSFVFLRGRCAFCHAPLSWRYPLVELTNALLYLAVFALLGWQPATLVYGLFVSSLLVVSLIDLDHQIIPDRISLPGILAGLLASFAIPWLSWQASLVGILLGGGSLYLVAAG